MSHMSIYVFINTYMIAIPSHVCVRNQCNKLQIYLPAHGIHLRRIMLAAQPRPNVRTTSSNFQHLLTAERIHFQAFSDAVVSSTFNSKKPGMSNTRNCEISTPSKNKVDMSTVLIGRNLAFGSFQSRNANLRRKPVKVALNRMKQRNRLNIEQKVVPTTCAPHTVLRLCFVGNYTMVPC